MSDVAINEVLAQMRALAAAAGNEAAPAGDGPAFADMMRESIDEVNSAMQASKTLAERFESGDPDVSLTELMVTAQKANLEFQALTEVRNKLLTAYQEVMNMQV